MATSYKITGIEPPDLAGYPADVRKEFWSWVVELGIKAKIKDILAGLDKDGKPLRPISAKTRKYRRSEMTPTGKGDPLAPPLVPGWQKSRTASLLAGRPLSNAAEFFWRYDAWTGDSWGKILRIQARKGRDVIGISPKAVAWVRSHAWAKWTRYKAGKLPAPKKRAMAVAGATAHDAQLKSHTVPGPEGGHGGSREEWREYFRKTATANLPGRPVNPPSKSPIVGPGYNRLIAHTWGQSPGPGRGGSAAPPTPRPGPRIPPAPKPATPVNRISKYLEPSKPPPKPKPALPVPAGNQVSQALDLSKAPVPGRLQAALKLVESVHGTGKATLGRLPVLEESEPYKRHGAFWRTASDKAVTITVDGKGTHPELNFLHEIGHYLEMFGIDGHKEAKRDFATDSTLAQWRKAIDASDALAKLKALRGQTGRGVADKTLDYLVSYKELWARSYAQYIATRTKDATLLAQLDRLRNRVLDPVYYSKHWEDADFAPIATAMDELFLLIGWRQ